MKERWNWFQVWPGYWCEIAYSSRSVVLNFLSNKHAVWHLSSFSPAIARRVGHALVRAARLAEKLGELNG